MISCVHMPRDSRLYIRISHAEKQELALRARQAGLSLSNWVRERLQMPRMIWSRAQRPKVESERQSDASGSA